MADSTLATHPRFSELTSGQQQLARRIVDAGLATPDDVIAAFVDRQNAPIGRWKAQLEGHPSRVPPPRQDERNNGEFPRSGSGASKSPWNLGYGVHNR